MKELCLEKRGNTWVCKEEEVVLYYGETKQGTCVIRNAYQEVILTFTYEKSGFKLFRSKQPVDFTFEYEGKAGRLLGEERTYAWTCGAISYTFVIGLRKGEVGVILRDSQNTVAYANGLSARIQPLYSAELCAVWMLMQDVKERVLMEEDKFERSIQQAELICV